MYMWCVVNRQERSHAQQLRDEQDEAYYESVRADQEKVRRLLLKFWSLYNNKRFISFLVIWVSNY